MLHTESKHPTPKNNSKKVASPFPENDLNNKSIKLIDNIYGKNGILFWVFPSGIIVMGYKGIEGVDAISHYGVTFNNVASLAIILVLLCVAIIVSVQGTLTAQKIVVKEKDISLRTFFGINHSFNKNQVCSIHENQPFPIIGRLLIPLGRGVKNYKLTFSSGQSFFISGSMTDTDILLAELRGHNTGVRGDTVKGKRF